MRRRGRTRDEAAAGDDFALGVATRELHWYARTKDRVRAGFYTVEVLQIAVAAGTALVAAVGAGRWLTAGFATATLLVTSFRQLFGFREKWARSAIAWSRIDHAIHQYRLAPGDREAAGRLLVERVDFVVAQETRAWSEHLQSAGGGGLEAPEPAPEPAPVAASGAGEQPAEADAAAPAAGADAGKPPGEEPGGDPPPASRPPRGRR